MSTSKQLNLLKAVLGLTLLLVVGMGTMLYIDMNAKNEELVFVNSGKLLAEYKGMQQAQAEFEKKSTVWKANVDTLASEVQNAIQDYEKSLAQLSDKEKELSRQLIQSKQQQLGQYQQAMQQKAAEEEQALTKTVLADVNAYLTDYGKEHGYKMILAATDAGNIVYAENGIDVTDDVLKGLNASL